MRNPVFTDLRTTVRNEIARAFDGLGFGRPRHIARQVCKAHPEIITILGRRLAEDALTDVVRREIKNTPATHQSASQVRLLGAAEVLTSHLRCAISIPEGDTVVYKPLALATFAEFEAHLMLLSTQIAADKRRHLALSELHDMAQSLGATPDDRVFDVLGPNQHDGKEVA